MLRLFVIQRHDTDVKFAGELNPFVVFIYLFDCCFTRYSRMFHVYYGGQEVEESRAVPGGWGVPMTIRRLLEDHA